MRKILAALVIVFSSCAVHNNGAVNLLTQKRFSQSDFQKLRWLEGSWRGTEGGQNPFYERYRFVKDSTIEIEHFADSTFSSPTGKGSIYFSDGEIVKRSGERRYVATKLDEVSVEFAPREKASNSFSWTKESRDAWVARLSSTNAQGGRAEKIYRMERLRP